MFVAPPPGVIIGAVLAIIGAALGVIGLILFILWWAICRFLTACDVILAAWNFVGALIAIFGVISIVLAILAAVNVSSVPCLIEAVVMWGYWGLLYWIISQIALAVGCLVASSGSSPPPTGSSSSGLSGDARRAHAGVRAARVLKQRGGPAFRIPLPAGALARPVGLGDVLSRSASGLGIRPCQKCHERAFRLNRAMTFGGSAAQPAARLDRSM